jgi:hypothetical protein
LAFPRLFVCLDNLLGCECLRYPELIEIDVAASDAPGAGYKLEISRGSYFFVKYSV